MSSPRLSIVICALGRPGADAAVTSVLDSAAAAGIDAQAVLVWQAQQDPPPLPPSAAVVRAFPAGVSYARNRGTAATAADVVAFIDDDERAARGWAAAVLTAFDEGADAAVGPIVPADNIGLAHCHFTGPALRWHTDLSTPPWAIGSGGNLAVRRAVFWELGGFDQRMGPGSSGRAAEDTEMLARLLARGARVRWRPDMVVTHPTKTAAERLAVRHPYGYGIGRMVRRLRSPALARRYGVCLLWGARAAIRERSPRRARELTATAAGFFSGLLSRDAWTAPAGLLERLPARISSELGARRLVAWPVPHRGFPHFLWAAGRDLVLHAYAGVPPCWSPGIEARRAALAAGARGVPAVVAAGSDDDVCWVLEQRLPGRHPHQRAEWWERAADWALSLARAAGPPLCTSVWWEQARARVPPTPDFTAALERLGKRPAVIVHGDLQPKNLLEDRDGELGVLDWEQAIVQGPPGLDLLYLAVTAREPAVRMTAVRTIAAGYDPIGTPVLARLRVAGLDGADVRAALTVAVHVWAADERARRQGLGTPPQPALFERLVAGLDCPQRSGRGPSSTLDG